MFSKWVELHSGKKEKLLGPFPTVFSKELYSRHVKLRLCETKREEKIGKGEITSYELVTCNFSFLHIVFKRIVLQTRKNKSLFGKELAHYHTTQQFKALKIYSCGKHCEKKRRNCFKQAISFFLTMFSTLYGIPPPFLYTL